MFNNFLSDVYSLIPKSTVLMQGQDANAVLGTKTKKDPEHKISTEDIGERVLGNHGLIKRDWQGKDTLSSQTTFIAYMAYK